MMSGSKIYQPPLPLPPPFLDEGNYPAPPIHKSFFLASFRELIGILDQLLEIWRRESFQKHCLSLREGCVCVCACTLHFIFITAFRKEKIEVSIFALICIDLLSVREQVDTKRATKTDPFFKKCFTFRMWKVE